MELNLIKIYRFLNVFRLNVHQTKYKERHLVSIHFVRAVYWQLAFDLCVCKE
jgi:hypothetical protein